MKNLNWGLVLCGVVGGIVALVLPIAEVGPLKIKLLDAGGHGVLVLACFVIGAAMGAHNLFKAPARWAAAVALVAFAIAGMKLSGGDDTVQSAAGADGGMILAFIGMVLGLILTIKPGRK
jgi:hypothetical protein